jgi:hypothetical protein
MTSKERISGDVKVSSRTKEAINTDIENAPFDVLFTVHTTRATTEEQRRYMYGYPVSCSKLML